MLKTGFIVTQTSTFQCDSKGGCLRYELGHTALTTFWLISFIIIAVGWLVPVQVHFLISNKVLKNFHTQIQWHLTLTKTRQNIFQSLVILHSQKLLSKLTYDVAFVDLLATIRSQSQIKYLLTQSNTYRHQCFTCTNGIPYMQVKHFVFITFFSERSLLITPYRALIQKEIIDWNMVFCSRRSWRLDRPKLQAVVFTTNPNRISYTNTVSFHTC